MALPLAVLFAAVSSLLASELTFEDHVRAQEAIERVYYSHQIGTTQPFEREVPREVLEKKVRTYLRESVALEEIWGTPVTARMLEAEMERIAKSTRFPERLREIVTALGEDPILVLECFARQSLVDRLARSFYADDERFHERKRAETELLRRRLVAGEIDLHQQREGRGVIEAVLENEGRARARGAFDRLNSRQSEPSLVELDRDQYERWRRRMPDRVGDIGPVMDERDTFVLRVLLEEEEGRASAATYMVAKTPWTAWWSEVEENFREDRAHQVTTELPSLPLHALHLKSDADDAIPTPEAAGLSSCPPDDSWDPDDVPSSRSDHSAVWTGSLMLVWGGTAQNTGGRYDPLTDTWTPISVTAAPASGSAVWSGSEMIVWTGSQGGRYNPVSDTWTPVSTTNAPSPRAGHHAVWADSRMIVWGGSDTTGVDPAYLTTGGRYDPNTNTWTPTSTSSAPVGIPGQTAVWTGSEMIVFGGRYYDEFTNAYVTSGAGSRYNPLLDTWTPIPNSGARGSHTAVWTGSAMIVWGGIFGSSSVLGDGARYSPVSNTWTAISTPFGIVTPKFSHTAVWTGTEMIVWGGGTGGRYNPSSNTWTATSNTNAPSARSGHTAVWAGGLMIVWGGDYNVFHTFSTGGRYSPATDSWTPTFHSGAPIARVQHTAVWTGSRMIVWGGNDHQTALNTGGQYDPLTHNWTPTNTVGAPTPRFGHVAVWSGNRMLVWGGDQGVDPAPGPTGGQYNPITDTWTTTSTIDAPDIRGSVAVWTGSEMLVFGVQQVAGFPKKGARYNPVSDIWTPISSVNAPEAAGDTAVWTGTEMIVWGGQSSITPFTNTGGRYRLSNDTWTPTSTTNAPVGRHLHVAVWTGSEMIVWGGEYYTQTSGGWVYPSVGGRYNPVINTWAPTTVVNAPAPRSYAAAVWTGSEMIVWGGQNTNTGGRYDPAADIWLPTTVTGSPSKPFGGHNAVWTGNHMIVWGGGNYGYDFPSDNGGIYDPGVRVDDDNDGFVCEVDCDEGNPVGVDADNDGAVCETDCDDGNPMAFWGAQESCDGMDNDCDAAIDEDGDGDGLTVCADCNDADRGSFAPPSAVSGLVVTRRYFDPPDLITLQWPNQSGASGSGTVYDIFSGPASTLRPSGNFSTGSCLVDNRVGNSSPVLWNDSTPVPAGQIRYYMIRGQNTCPAGTSTYGTAQRDSSAGLSSTACD